MAIEPKETATEVSLSKLWIKWAAWFAICRVGYVVASEGAALSMARSLGKSPQSILLFSIYIVLEALWFGFIGLVLGGVIYGVLRTIYHGESTHHFWGERQTFTKGAIIALIIGFILGAIRDYLR